MIKNLMSWEVFTALSLALISQTAYRFEIGVGIGELCLALFVGATLIQVPFQNYKNFIPPHLNYIKHIFLFWVFALTPITIISSYSGLEGSSLRDILAYMLSLLFIIAIIVKRLNLSKTGIYFTLIFIAICLIQFLFGEENAWYGDSRFVGGAKNPNQLALYIVCLLAILPTLNLHTIWKVLITGCLVTLGLMSRSDALILTFVLIAAVWLGMYLIPRSGLIGFLLIVSFPIFFGLYYIAVETTLIQQVTDIWTSADEGNTRLSLLINGLKAYGSTPAAWPFGFGAGAYSGEDGTFGGREAHNTLVDFLTIGGILGVYLLYAPLISSGWIAYCRKWHLLAALLFGLFAFSMFHFVARHPVFWFTIVITTHALYKHELKLDQYQSPLQDAKS